MPSAAGSSCWPCPRCSWVCIFANFVPFIFVILFFGFAGSTLEALLRCSFDHVCADFTVYYFPSKTTFVSFSITVLVVEIVCIGFREINCLLASWARIAIFYFSKLFRSCPLLASCRDFEPCLALLAVRAVSVAIVTGTEALRSFLRTARILKTIFHAVFICGVRH